MKWGTLILIAIAIIAVVGVIFFVLPYDWLKDTLDTTCNDAGYEYEDTNNVEVWYDTSVAYKYRRIVHDPYNVDGRDWRFIDKTFTDPRYPDRGYYRVYHFTPQSLREQVQSDFNDGIVPSQAWHWFDCTICATQGECP